MDADTLLPLDCLRIGEAAEVAVLDGDPVWIGRMAELGLRVGCRLEVLQPGSPCLLRVGDARLCLRGDWLAHVLVRPTP